MSELGHSEEQPKAIKPDEVLMNQEEPAQREARREFEQKLFSTGILEFSKADLEQFINEENRDLEEDKKHWNSMTSHYNEEERAKGFATAIRQSHNELIWMKNFSGKVPKHWDNWASIVNDFREAHQEMPSVPLTHTLVDAGITHPDSNVRLEVGKTQRLNKQQLEYFFLSWTMDFPPLRKDHMKEVIAAQRGFGTSVKDIWAARFKARNVRKQMEKEGTDLSSDPRLQSPSHTDQ